jgi:hypothetical protein
MKDVTFVVVAVFIPAVFAYGVLALSGEWSLFWAALTFALLSLIGAARHKAFWEWARHQVVTGQDAGWFMLQMVFLYLLPAGAWYLSYRLFSYFGREWPVTTGGAVAAACFLAILFLFAKSYTPFIRGVKVLEMEEAQEVAAAELPPGDPGFPFGGLVLQSIVSLMHFLLVGAVGAGKTKILEALMKRFLPTLNQMDARAIISDPKHEFLRYVDSLALGVKVVIFDPTDERCAMWDIAADILDEDDSATLAEIFVPKNERASQPFFDNAARELLQAVVETLIRRKPGRWTLRDIVYCMRSMKRIKALIGTTDEGRDLIEQFLSKEKTAQDVMSTIGTVIGRFKTVAKSWHRAKKEGRTVSIDEWMHGNFIIMLGSSEKAAASVQAINHLFFKRLSQVLLDEPDNDQADLLSPRSRRHYLFLDEVRLAGRLDGLNELFLKGRSKGVVIVVSVQDQKGMAEVYGENIADEQLSQAATVAILRTQNVTTAKWASDLIGEKETLQRSQSTGAEGKASETVSSSVKVAVLPSEIRGLPLSGPKNGLQGYFLSPTVGVWKASLPWAEVMAARAPLRESKMVNYERRLSNPNEPLPTWDDKELSELGISRADLEGEKEVEDSQEPEPSAEEEKALENLARMQYEDELGK